MPASLHQRRTHPTPVEGCFGCKVGGIGYDGKHLTNPVTDENNNTVTEHRSGRVDVLIRPPHYAIRGSEQR